MDNEIHKVKIEAVIDRAEIRKEAIKKSNIGLLINVIEKDMPL